jgi:hypothetical protein
MAQADGLLVFNEAKTFNGLPQYKQYASGVGFGNLPSTNVNAIAKDTNGAIWIGTNKGISIVSSPSSVFSSVNSDAKQPIVDGFPLLFDQIVTAIDVDGGNRKWVGTSNGLYLLSADGLRVIYNFTTANCPLPSNTVSEVNINHQTGEVFIITDKGMISFREAATQGFNEEISTPMQVFPNPVSVNYTGQIGFLGLATNAAVKITDISGQLVYQTQANGGAASWNGRNYNGQKVTAGVYIIFSSTQDGNFGLAGKLFVTE